jgi:ABC-type multidrug transport system fused ATPase/permease subunit
MSGARVIRALSRTQWEQSAFGQVNDDLAARQRRADLTMAVVSPITSFILNAALALVVLLGSVFVGIRFMSQTREAHIRRELDAGASEIAIFAMPYKYTTWDHLWAQAFYNDTGRDVTFYSIPFDEWMNDIY